MTRFLFLLPALALATAPALAQTMSPQDYVKAAGASDLYERQSAQVVLQSTKNPKIRSFANMMLVDHNKSTQLVKSAALKSHVTVSPPQLTPEQATMLAQLKSESGTSRDSKYVAEQKAAHQQALTVHQDYAANGTAPALNATARQIVPVVKHHIALLNSM